MRRGKPGDAFTEREIQTLDLLAKGFNDQEIADQMHLALDTIKSYSAHARTKFDVHPVGRVRTALSWRQFRMVNLLDEIEGRGENEMAGLTPEERKGYKLALDMLTVTLINREDI